MRPTCNIGTNIPELQESPCPNGCYTSDACTVHSQAITYLNLPANSSVNTIIQNLILNQMYQDELIAELTTLVGDGGVQSISGDYVDNTDPRNPILNDPRPYKVYSAIFHQEGTDDPTVEVLENTIGEIVWTRTQTGVFTGTLEGAFQSDKTFVEHPANSTVFITKTRVQTGNDVVFEVYNVETGVFTDNILRMYVGIRVYN